MSNEDQIAKLEEEFPHLSPMAFAKAQAEALAAGNSVLIAHQGVIYRLHPDGTREKVKDIEPPTRVEPGTIVELK